MKRQILTALAVVCLLVSGVSNLHAQSKGKGKDAAPAAAGEELKIGVFDIQKILRDSKVVEGYRQKLGQEIGEKRKQLGEKQKSAIEIEEKLKKDGFKLSVEERKTLEDKLSSEVKELKRLKEDVEEALKKSDRELTQKTLQEISKIIKQVFDKEGYTIIFEKSGASIAIFKESVDITNKIIKLYDK